MRPHFAQLTPSKAGEKKLGEVTVPPAWIIDQIKRRKPLEERPQPRLEIEEYPPPGWKRPGEKRDQEERGVCIIEYSV